MSGVEQECHSSSCIISCIFYCLSQTCTQGQAEFWQGDYPECGVILIWIFLACSPLLFRASACSKVARLFDWVRNTAEVSLCRWSAKLPDLGCGLKLSSNLSRESEKTPTPKAEYDILLVSAFWCFPHPNASWSLFWTNLPLARWWFCLTITHRKSFNL